jgi:hypothetical protein
MASDSLGPRRVERIALLVLLVLIAAVAWWLMLAKWYLNVCLPDPAARRISGYEPPAICWILE